MKIPSHCPSAVSHFSVETANPPNYSDTMNVLPEGLPSLDFAENFFAQNSFHSSSTLPLLPTNIKWNEVSRNEIPISSEEAVSFPILEGEPVKCKYVRIKLLSNHGENRSIFPKFRFSLISFQVYNSTNQMFSSVAGKLVEHSPSRSDPFPTICMSPNCPEKKLTCFMTQLLYTQPGEVSIVFQLKKDSKKNISSIVLRNLPFNLCAAPLDKFTLDYSPSSSSPLWETVITGHLPLSEKRHQFIISSKEFEHGIPSNIFRLKLLSSHPVDETLKKTIARFGLLSVEFHSEQ
eukprot:TRINITY_DN2798_c0_g1_i2.p1 TRINITY_DN2798_c0_g1~~TRINITY_DN2798_c0_g1_i2.p1  ORF type:complete len:291 (+),score=96.42 TRINITY_DN2798_c0_g1_i2:213-1085(+)